MLELILEKIATKPDMQVLKLTSEEGQWLYDWLKQYHFAGAKLPDYSKWLETAGFLGRKIELSYGEEDN